MSKIDPVKLQDLVNQRLKPAEIARRLGVNPSSITRAMQKGLAKTTQLIAVDRTLLGTIVKQRLDLMGQIVEVNNDALYLHRQIMRYIKGEKHAFKKMQRRVKTKSTGGKDGRKNEEKIETFDFTVDPRLLATYVMQEIGRQWGFYTELMGQIYSPEEIRIFTSAIVTLLGETDKGLIGKFRDLLIKKRSLLVKFNPVFENLADDTDIGQAKT